MIEMFLVVFMACGHPVFVVMQPVGKDMRVYSQESMSKERWVEFLRIIEESKVDLSVAWLELPVEDQTKDMVCIQST